MANQPEKSWRHFINKKNIVISILVLFVFLVVGLNVYRIQYKDVIKVRTTEVKQQELVQVVLASGKVEASDRSVIVSQVSGTVKKVHVKLGDQVVPGTLLMELDIPDGAQKIAQAEAAWAKAEADLAKARAAGKSVELIEAEAALVEAKDNYELAKDKLDRYQVLYDQGAVSQEEMEQIQSQYRVSESRYKRAEASMKSAQAGAAASLAALEATAKGARANLELLQSQMGQGGIRAKRSGRVLSLGAREGDLITPNMALITIGDPDSLRITAGINEADASQLMVGQKAIITGSAIMDKEYIGYVTEIGLEAASSIKNDTESTDVPIMVSLPSGTPLRTGYNVDLEITTLSDKKALVVPYEAIIEKKGQPYVYVVRDNKARQIKVETGINDNLVIQITKGLKKGDKVILNPPDELKDGSKVRE